MDNQLPVTQRQESYLDRALKNIHFDLPDTNEWIPSTIAEEDLYDPWTMLSLTIPKETEPDCTQSDSSSNLNESFGKRKLDDTVKFATVKKQKTKFNVNISDVVMANLETQPYIVGFKKVLGMNLTMVQYIETEQSINDLNNELRYNIKSRRCEDPEYPRRMEKYISSNKLQKRLRDLNEDIKAIPKGWSTNATTMVRFDKDGVEYGKEIWDLRETGFDIDSKLSYFQYDHKGECYWFSSKTKEDALTPIEIAALKSYFCDPFPQGQFQVKKMSKNLFDFIVPSSATKNIVLMIASQNIYQCDDFRTVTYQNKKNKQRAPYCRGSFNFTVFNNLPRIGPKTEHTCNV